MTLPTKEQDFDFRRNTHLSLFKKQAQNKWRLNSVIFGGVFLCFMISIMPHSKSHDIVNVKATPPVEKSILTFKSLTPSSLLTVQNALEDVFSLNAGLYTDKSSVRVGLRDKALDKAQGDLLKEIQSSIAQKPVNGFVSVHSKLTHISVLAFDSTTNKMTVEVNYSAKINYKDNQHVDMYFYSSVYKQNISLSLNKHAKIESIELLKTDNLTPSLS